MPPAAATVAARRAAPERELSPARDASAQARTAPARARTAPAHTRTAPARPRTAPARPRRAPHPAPSRERPAASPRPLRIDAPAKDARRVRRAEPHIAARTLQGPRLLDRIIRGRAWIPVLGVLLVGIVGMRVEVLKLGARVGTEMQQASALQSANELLSSRVSALSQASRIESRAAQMGMYMPRPTDVHLVQASAARDVGRAVADITRPAPQSFLNGLQSERAQNLQAEQKAANTSAVGVLATGYVSGGSTSSTATASTTATNGGASSTASGSTASGTGGTVAGATSLQTATASTSPASTQATQATTSQSTQSTVSQATLGSAASGQSGQSGQAPATTTVNVPAAGNGVQSANTGAAGFGG